MHTNKTLKKKNPKPDMHVWLHKKYTHRLWRSVICYLKKSHRSNANSSFPTCCPSLGIWPNSCWWRRESCLLTIIHLLSTNTARHIVWSLHTPLNHCYCLLLLWFIVCASSFMNGCRQTVWVSVVLQWVRNTTSGVSIKRMTCLGNVNSF